jgi:hypothetical protein
MSSVDIFDGEVGKGGFGGNHDQIIEYGGIPPLISIFTVEYCPTSIMLFEADNVFEFTVIVYAFA